MTAKQKKSRNDVRIALIQFRDDPIIKSKEYNSFVKYMALQPEQVISFDALNVEITNSLIDGFDGLVVGGTGGHNVEHEYDFTQSVLDLIKHAYDTGFPTLNVCFGAQLATVALGGVVESIPEMKETGTYKMYLTDAGRADFIFAGVNDKFDGQMGHNDTVTTAPEGAVHLTYSDRVHWQAFRMPNKPFYAVQYHAELDDVEIRERFEYYKDAYADNPEEFQEILDKIRPSIDASKVLENFIDAVVLEHPIAVPTTTEKK